MAIEIVSFPIKNCDFPWLCERLPEGNVTKLLNDLFWLVVYQPSEKYEFVSWDDDIRN